MCVCMCVCASAQLLLKAKITNTGKQTVDLSGVRFVLDFSGRVRVPTFDRCVAAAALLVFACVRSWQQASA